MDRDSRLTSRFSQAVAEILGVKLALTTAYHQSANGQQERMNQVIITKLRAMMLQHSPDWLLLIPLVAAAINRTPNATGYSPYNLMFGLTPRLALDGLEPKAPKVPSAQDFFLNLAMMNRRAREILADNRERTERYGNLHRRPAPQYEVGDEVLIKMEGLIPNEDVHLTSKLKPKWIGPYKVTECDYERENYTIMIPPNWLKHNVFHTSKLKPYKANDPIAFPSRGTPPPAPEIDEAGYETWELEKILSYRKFRGQEQYLVRWKGFTEENNSWEPATNFPSPMLGVYWKSHQWPKNNPPKTN